MWNEERRGDCDVECQVRKKREKRKDINLMDTKV
jgi:hypothetical protein